MKQLIAYAYDVSPLVIAGDIAATRFEVEGKAEGAHTRGEFRLMPRALLADRFGLRLHRETRELSVDAPSLANPPSSKPVKRLNPILAASTSRPANSPTCGR